MSKVSPVPADMHTLTPYLICQGAAQAIDYYVRAFGAVELARLPAPNGLIMHALLKIGDSPLMLSDAMPECGAPDARTLGGSPVFLHMYVEDVDTVFARALAEGGQELMAVQDMFWGDRYGQLQDPFGHRWSLATHMEDLSPEQVSARAGAFMSSQGCGGPG
ncbi:VOC family protein [Orrella sp. JC864]|uniref:VOC family protein n=1 Tax=Orrella sp. JC864 TaxID=3120298 RepID=UPI0012BCF3DC